MPFIRNNQGIVILYALLIIGLITAIAITVSVVVVNEIKLTTTSTDAALAYYAAESGVERGLYEVKIMRYDGESTLSSAVLAIQGLSDALSNGAQYDNGQTKDKSAAISNAEIKENHFIQADYIDFDNPLSPSVVTQSLVVTNSGNDPDSWAEVSWIAWDNTGTLGESEAARKYIGPTDLQNGWTINQLDVFSGINPVGYRIRIKALFGDLSSISVVPYDQANGTGGVVDLPSLVEVKSIGKKGPFKQSLTATVPWKVPLYQLYDYVLFSESDIQKTIILGNPTYSSGVIEIETNNVTAGVCSGCTGAGSCADNGWLASSCSAAVSCNIVAGDTSYCSLPNNNDYFVLPIPDTVPAGPEYYISIRTESSNNGGDAEIMITDPEEGELGFVFTYADNTAGWTTCTLPDAFALGNNTNRTVRFTNQDSDDSLDIDWYQISSYKIYQDCE